MSARGTKKGEKSKPMKLVGGKYHGAGTMVRFSDCDGILVCANMRDLRKLARGFFLADFDPKKAKRVTVSERK